MSVIYSGLLAPVPVTELAKLASGHEVVAGSGQYNAIVEREPGSSIEWASAIAEELTKHYPGEIHAFDTDGDEFYWLVTYCDGVRTYDAEGLPAPSLLGIPIEIG